MYRVPIAHGHALRTTDILSAGLDSGVAISVILIFFALQVWEIEVDWWGNSVSNEGCDASGDCVRMTLAEGDYFGPRIGEFH